VLMGLVITSRGEAMGLPFFLDRDDTLRLIPRDTMLLLSSLGLSLSWASD
jgi:hypothetical protein